jgi:hypothetical protein
LIRYFDTSALVKRYLSEPGSARVSGWIEERSERAVSRVALVEALSAFSRRVREKHLTPAARVRLWRKLEEDLEAFVLVDVHGAVLERAATLCTRHPLRTLDAVHLASALEILDGLDEDVSFASADASLLRIAEAVGLVPEDPAA